MGFVVAVVPVWLHTPSPRAVSGARRGARLVWPPFGAGPHLMRQVVAVVL
jgi:hypothetical protein